MDSRTSQSEFVIRKAAKEDIPAILKLIRELAEFEKLSHEVLATEELLADSLFTENPVARVLMGEYHDEVVACAQAEIVKRDKRIAYLEDSVDAAMDVLRQALENKLLDEN